MKSIIKRTLLSPSFQVSALGKLSRSAIRATRNSVGYSANFMLASQAIERPHYAYCMLGAAQLAKELGHDRISAIEFGVAGGNGPVFMTEFAKEIRKETGVTIDCYGFDTGEGMPDPQGVHDLPYWFAAQQYPMDRPALERRIGDAKLVIGNVVDTIPNFLKEHEPAPIGVVFNDTDYWSSTRDSLSLYDQIKDNPQHFLPRIFNYFDDIRGSEYEMYGPHNGQLLAIEEFNARSETVKIHLNQNLIPDWHLEWRYHIYYTHAFDHPDYSKRIGDERHEAIHDALKLKS